MLHSMLADGELLDLDIRSRSPSGEWVSSRVHSLIMVTHIHTLSLRARAHTHTHILWRIGQLHCGDTLMRLAQQFYVCMLADWKIGK